MNTTDIGKRFLTRSAHHLRDDYLPKVREAVALLSEDELWRREGDVSNSIGNLLLHMAGNVRQHIIAGVGQRHADRRDRPAEFAAQSGPSKTELMAKLEQTVSEAADVLESFDPAQLLTKRVIQNKDVVLLDDIYHVVEHFGYHTGQIIYIVKALKQQPFKWYKKLDKTP